MRVIVYYKSGMVQEFIVPDDILATKLFEIIEEAGGPVARIEFP